MPAVEEEEGLYVSFLVPSHYDTYDGHALIYERDVDMAMACVGRQGFFTIVPDVQYYGIQPEDTNRPGRLAAHAVIVLSNRALTPLEARLLVEKEMERQATGD